MRTLYFVAVTILAATTLDSRAGTHTMNVALNSGAVALQFDVASSVPGLTLNATVMDAAPDHVVESAALPAPNLGKTRFLVYSPSNLPLAPAGAVSVQLGVPNDSSLVNGILTVSGLVTSTANGTLSSAQPNALPLILQQSPTSRTTVQIGDILPLTARVADLDGSLSSAQIRLDGSQVLGLGSTMGSYNWSPTSSGNAVFTVTATDNSGGNSTTEPVTLRSFSFATLAGFADFQDVFFGDDKTNPAKAGPSADPFGTGIPNLLAYVAGMDPANPDFSLLPSFQVEKTGSGHEAVFSYSRIQNLTGVTATIRQGSNLPSPSSTVPAAYISATPSGSGRERVTARVPVANTTSLFMSLALEPQP
ncbi:MAG: hypothetical protein Fur0032_11750 [Terrimicrobiaceae bacterium]